MEERRSLRRFNLQLMCLIRARCRGRDMHCELRTKNISSGGAYFSAPSPFGVGTRVAVQITIQRSDHTDSSPRGSRISVKGEVLRADAYGMAVEFDDQYHISQISQERNDGATLNCFSGGMDPLSCSFQEFCSERTTP